MSARFACVLLVLACCSCSIGLPLVDKHEQDPPGQILPCAMPPRCEEPFMMVFAPDHPAKPIAGCASPTLCQLGDKALGLGGCSADPPLEVLPETANCQRLQLQAAPDMHELMVSEPDWSDVNVTLRADQATTITLSAGTLQRVHLELHGPIALRVERTRMLSDLRIEGEATERGAPSVTLDDFLGKNVSVGSASADFPGSITLHALQLSDADMRAQRIVIESTSIDTANLHADTIHVTDLSLLHANVEASSALWSSYDVEDSVLKFCGDARLIDGDFSRAGLSSCLESPLRVYMSTINSSILDGNFELDQVSLNNSRLAINDTTRVLAFQTSMMSTRLCERVEQLALGPTSQLRCSDCAVPFGKGDRDEGDQPFCMLPADPELRLEEGSRAQNPLKDNYCKSWEDLSVPPCADDLPSRPDRRR